MSVDNEVTGRCLCGGVKFRIKPVSHDVSVCHCSMCRRWSGGAALFVESRGEPVLTGAENIAVYRASAWGERGFCRACGSNLFWKVAGKDHYTFSAGALDDPSHLKLATEIFIEDKPAYYEFANDTVKQTGPEAMAAFVSSDATVESGSS